MYKKFEFSLPYIYKLIYMNLHLNIIDTKLEYNGMTFGKKFEYI